MMTIKALVVDNNPVHLKAISTFLENEGCRISIATNGLEGLEKIQSDKPDILFTDIVMPLVDGEKLCQIVRQVDEYSDIFVVVMSALQSEEKERFFPNIDCDATLEKGSLTELRNDLHTLIYQFTNRDSSSFTVPKKGHRDKITTSSVTQELLMEINHLRKMLENIAEGVIELSSGGKIVSVNQAALSIWNCRREEMIGKNLELLFEGSHYQDILKWRQEQLGRKDGNIFEIQENYPLLLNDKILIATLIPVHHSEGQFGVCIFRDISRQYYAEKKKEEMDNAVKLIKRMEAMSFMAGGVAHDFNNLLTVICGNLDMMNSTCSQQCDDFNSKFLGSARDAAFAAVDLIRKISTVSPYGIVKRETLCLEEEVEGICREFFSMSGEHGYAFSVCDRGNYVAMDRAQIKRAMHNVLQNSMEARSIRDVSIYIEREQLDDVSIRQGQLLSAGDYVRVDVQDWGVGISAMNLHEIFDPYFSTKERGALKGMGLGLTIVYSTLRNHGGYAIVQSQEGMGTTVSLYLPISHSDSPFHPRVRESILLVEGDEEMRGISTNMLEYLGYSVVAHGECGSAVTEMQNRMKRGEKFVAAFVQTGGDATETGALSCRMFHDVDHSLPVIVCGATSLDTILLDYREYGFAAALAKPYTIDEYRKVLQRVRNRS